MNKQESKVLRCNCKNPEQDELHGYRMRVHNACIRAGDLWAYRCTSCRNEKKV